jgi:hypothetical protein
MSNNINKRINNKINNISKNQNKNKLTFKEKLQPYTQGFIDIIKGKSKPKYNNNININQINKNNKNNNSNNNNNNSPFSNPLVLGLILLIAILFISYGLYQYYKSSNNILMSKTYYGSNLLEYKPVFDINTSKIEECINRCNIDTLCNGITYDDDTQKCYGTKKGKLRSDTINYKAWVKPDKEDVNIRTGKLIGYSHSFKIVYNNNIPRPKLPGEFNYSFYIYIKNFYDNQGTWRNIFQKGEQNTLNNDKHINTPNWTDIETNYPNQSIGVWIAPFNNNMRIALTTIKTNKYNKPEYKHAYKQNIISNDNKHNVYISDVPYGRYKDPTLNSNNIDNIDNNIDNNFPNINKQIEYIDIYRIPNKKLIHISVNVTGMTIEIFMNGKLYKMKNLEGYPDFNNGNLYNMPVRSINGSIIDLKFTPRRLLHKEIQELLSNMDKLQNKKIQEISKIMN